MTHEVRLLERAFFLRWGVGCGDAGVPGVYTDVSKMMCYVAWAARCRGRRIGGVDGGSCGPNWANEQGAIQSDLWPRFRQKICDPK